MGATLAYIIPAILVMATAYLVLERLLRNERDRRNFELAKLNQSVITPTRLRAYERLSLVLERTKPNTLIMNTIKPSMTSFDLHSALLTSIRNEFAHNVSQQIYVSDLLWVNIVAAQESLVKLINGCATKVPADGVATDFAELIINTYAMSDEAPSDVALRLLKEEMRKMM